MRGATTLSKLSIKKYLEKASKTLFEWFLNTPNANEYHQRLSFHEDVSIRASEFDIRNSVCEKQSSVKFDYKLTFEKDIVDT